MKITVEGFGNYYGSNYTCELVRLTKTQVVCVLRNGKETRFRLSDGTSLDFNPRRDYSGFRIEMTRLAGLKISNLLGDWKK